MALPIENLPSPYEFWMMAEAVYKENGLLEKTSKAINEHIKKQTNKKIHLIELDKTSASPWIFGLFKIDMVGQKVLVVAFQGSQSSFQWLDNIANPKSGLLSALQLAKISNAIKSWEKKYIKKYKKKYEKPSWGKIVALTGHSRGGDFASNCFMNKKIWRITWNGFNANVGPQHFNLATKDDPLTSKSLIASPDLYTRICDGGHSIYDFKEAVKASNWAQLLLLRKKPPMFIAKL